MCNRKIYNIGPILSKDVQNKLPVKTITKKLELKKCICHTKMLKLMKKNYDTGKWPWLHTLNTTLVRVGSISFVSFADLTVVPTNHSDSRQTGKYILCCMCTILHWVCNIIVNFIVTKAHKYYISLTVKYSYELNKKVFLPLYG